MKPITLLFWLLFGWFAPFFFLLVLYLKVMSMILFLLVQIFVLFCQGALKLAGNAVSRAELYLKNRRIKQIEQIEEMKQIEGAKL